MVLLPISLDSGVLLSSPVPKMEPKRKRIRITKFSIWGCDFQKGQPTMKRSFATYIHACCSAVQRQHGEAFSSQPHDTNSITLSRHHVKWQWQAYCCSGAINYSVACIVNLHFQMIQTDSVQCHWARSSKFVPAVPLALCTSRIQTKWYSRIQRQCYRRAKSLQAHAHEATEPNCTSLTLVPSSNSEPSEAALETWRVLPNVNRQAEYLQRRHAIRQEKLYNNPTKNQTSPSALSVGAAPPSLSHANLHTALHSNGMPRSQSSTSAGSIYPPQPKRLMFQRLHHQHPESLWPNVHGIRCILLLQLPAVIHQGTHPFDEISVIQTPLEASRADQQEINQQPASAPSVGTVSPANPGPLSSALQTRHLQRHALPWTLPSTSWRWHWTLCQSSAPSSIGRWISRISRRASSTQGFTTTSSYVIASHLFCLHESCTHFLTMIPLYCSEDTIMWPGWHLSDSFGAMSQPYTFHTWSLEVLLHIFYPTTLLHQPTPALKIKFSLPSIASSTNARASSWFCTTGLLNVQIRADCGCAITIPATTCLNSCRTAGTWISHQTVQFQRYPIVDPFPCDVTWNRPATSQPRNQIWSCCSATTTQKSFPIQHTDFPWLC